MYDEPSESPTEDSSDPKVRANEKAAELRTHAELAAVFEATRKFEAEIRPKLDPDLARQIQQTMGKLAKAKSADMPLIPETSAADAIALLDMPARNELSTNDYHVHRRPGEVMVVRFLAGEQVETFYERLQAHFDAAMGSYIEDERQQNEWKKDAKATAYLKALDGLKVRMAEWYAREPIRQHKLLVLSTQTADEINIQYLTEHLMGAAPVDLVGPASAPPDDPNESDLAWFFKLFSLRGIVDGQERMCFFAFLQKTDEAW
jgi:hypothetical protein